jgi:hypothetical protein
MVTAIESCGETEWRLGERVGRGRKGGDWWMGERQTHTDIAALAALQRLRSVGSKH